VLDWNNCSWKAPIIHLTLNQQLTGNESHHPNRQRIATPTDSKKKKLRKMHHKNSSGYCNKSGSRQQAAGGASEGEACRYAKRLKRDYQGGMCGEVRSKAVVGGGRGGEEEGSFKVTYGEKTVL
jgi:hypothetical protein